MIMTYNNGNNVARNNEFNRAERHSYIASISNTQKPKNFGRQRLSSDLFQVRLSGLPTSGGRSLSSLGCAAMIVNKYIQKKDEKRQ